MSKPSQQRHNEEREGLLAQLRDLQRTVPLGRYAVLGDNGLMEWYDVRQEGRNARTVVTRLDLDDGPQRVQKVADELSVLTRIMADPAGAAQRYEDNTNKGGSMP